MFEKSPSKNYASGSKAITTGLILIHYFYSLGRICRLQQLENNNLWLYITKKVYRKIVPPEGETSLSRKTAILDFGEKYHTL